MHTVFISWQIRSNCVTLQTIVSPQDLGTLSGGSLKLASL